MIDVDEILRRGKRDIADGWDTVVDGIREMQQEYEEKIGALEDEIYELKNNMPPKV